MTGFFLVAQRSKRERLYVWFPSPITPTAAFYSALAQAITVPVLYRILQTPLGLSWRRGELGGLLCFAVQK